MSAETVDLSRYTAGGPLGSERYIKFAEEILGLRLAREQRELLRALAEHKRVVVMSGNGPGKSYGVAIAKLAFLVTNAGSTVLGTSGSYSQYVDAVWRPLKNLHRNLNRRLPVDLPEPTDGGQPTLELDNDWFAKVVSPRDPGDLEGRHGDAVLVVIEEADKAYIEDEHFDSAGSSITDAADRMIAICNPPRDEANAVYERLDSDRWHTIQFSTLDSHNVRVDAGELDEPKIPGITDLETIREDWEAWNGEPWPGIERARVLSDPDHPDFRTDLDERWYRRRAGVIPPEGAATHRPFYPADVDSALANPVPRETADAYADEHGPPPVGIGIDVARKGGDSTVVCLLYDTHTRFREWSEHNHTENEARIRDILDEFRNLPPTAIDAVGEGSGVADRLREGYSEVYRFKAGTKPDVDEQAEEYYNKWTEGLVSLGRRLDGIGIEQRGHRRIREELFTAARTIEFEVNTRRSGDLLKATPKEEVKERLGRSPDSLDALVMAAWAADDNATARINVDDLGWGS